MADLGMMTVPGGRRWSANTRDSCHHGHSGPSQPRIPARRREMLRLGAPAPLARGRPLPWMRQQRGGPERALRHAAVSAAVSLPGVRVALRRPQRDSAGRAPPAAAGLGVVPLLHGSEPVQPADRCGTGPEPVRHSGDDGTTAPGSGRHGAGGGVSRPGGDRRGLRGGGPQGPTGGSGQKGRLGRRRRLQGAPGRGTAATDKPPILGLIQRGGQLVIRMLANVQQKTIQPVITATVAPDSLIHTDEYDIYARLPAWGYRHKTVCHGRGEYARDEDGDGFCEVHVNTMEGVWSLLRSWLRPHRGISQEKLPIYLGFFEFVHNARRRGKALLGTLIAALVMGPAATPPETTKSLQAYRRVEPYQSRG